MSKVLKIECIYDNWGLPPEVLIFVPFLNDGKKMPKRYWVAEITGLHPKFKYDRTFISYKKDYAQANSKGTRGVYAYFILEEEKIYEVKQPVSNTRNERYFCKIVNNELVRISEEEVIKCLKNT